jgi:hypothetical protein
VERVAGFGPKFHPWTADEARTALRPQIVALESAFRDLAPALRGDRLVVEATVVPNYIAASYFPQRLFDEADLVVLGSRPVRAPYRTEGGEERQQLTKTLIVGATFQSLTRLDQLASEDQPTRREARLQEDFRPLQDLHLAADTEVVRDAPEATELYEAVLHPEWNAHRREVGPASSATFDKWVTFIESLGGHVVDRYRRAVGGLTFVPIVLDHSQILQAAAFNPLRVLRPMPKMRPLPPTPLRSAGRPAAIPSPEPTPSSNERVAVFDGGWDRSCHLTAPFTTIHDLTPEPEHAESVEHGSLVTAATLFGNVDATLPLPRPAFYVDHYRVLPVPPAEQDLDLNWVLDRIVETVRSSGHRLVNLSLGPYLPVDDAEPHRWTSELDQLAVEREVLFVVAVGNNGDGDPAAGLNRVQVPGDMANGLAVGACTDGQADGWTRAPYSAVGPGRQGARVKPTGVAFGGDGAANPYIGVGAGGDWYEAHGTSFAAPLVTHSVGVLLPEVSTRGSSVDFLRAMAVHFAEPTELPVEEVGHGRFRSDLTESLDCAPESVTVLYRDTLRRGEVVGFPIPMPDDVAGNVGLRWTLAITSPVDPADAAEYTLAGVELQFRPHARNIIFTAPDNSGTVVVNIDRDVARATALLREGYRPGENAATRAGRRVRVSEFSRRDEGKWETLIHARDRLRAPSLLRPRLDLSYFARSRGLLVDASAPDLDVTMIVSIDARPGSDVYDRVRALYPVLTPVAVPIQARIRA